MKKSIYLFIALGICLSTLESVAQSSNLTQAYENGFSDGYSFGVSNNLSMYQLASNAITNYTTGGGPGSGVEYLAAYRKGLLKGWTQGKASFDINGLGECTLPICDEENPYEGLTLEEKFFKRFFPSNSLK